MGVDEGRGHYQWAHPNSALAPRSLAVLGMGKHLSIDHLFISFRFISFLIHESFFRATSRNTFLWVNMRQANCKERGDGGSGEAPSEPSRLAVRRLLS